MTSYTVQPSQKPLLGHAFVPGDKSIAHRALLLSGLARGGVRITGIGQGADNRSSARALGMLGVSVVQEPGEDGAPDAVVVRGRGLRGLRSPHREIDCGNSGTTMRLLAGMLAGQSFPTRLTGDKSLSGRPMLRIIQPLARMGATITGRVGQKPGEMYPPLAVQAVRGRLSPLQYSMPIASAQVKSAILLAALYADGVTRIREAGPSRDHTERLLARMGAPIKILPERVIELDTRGLGDQLGLDHIEVPGDPSQAAFIIAAGLLAGVERVTVGRIGINQTRTGFLDALAHMNALVEKESMELDRSEPIANLSISRGAGDQLQGTRIDGELTVRCIDELPILAVIAARARGVTEIRDAAELRVKESDRIATTCDLLRALGVEVEEYDDGMAIQGDPERLLRSARVRAHGDHRIAMSAAIAGLVAEGPVRVDGVDCVDTSFPTFVEVLRTLGAEVAVSGR